MPTVSAPRALARPHTESKQHIRHEQARSIRLAIRASERRWRQRLPALRLQSTLGMASLALALAVVVGTSLLYLFGHVPAWMCIFVNAMGISILREVEHDLIHNLYLRGRTGLQNALLLLIWPFMGNSLNPLFRRITHLHHHRRSGHEDDFEERLIGNGLPWGAVRLIATLDPVLSLPLRLREFRHIPGFSLRRLLLGITPMVPLFHGAWYAFAGCHAAVFASRFAGTDWAESALLQGALAVLDPLAVVWIVPNLVRQVSLQILSSNMHYYGDVEHTLAETQVLNHWLFLPLQLFTFNFGGTHTIHHFAVNQPFYLRQLVAREAHAAMRANGIRFNDLATFCRANRYRRQCESVRV
jgi:fatty acid desaturase